jgi:hypothetical protein
MAIERKYWPIHVLAMAMFSAWMAWGLVFNKMSPYQSPEYAIPLMYITGFLCVMLTVCTFAALLRLAFLPHRTVAYHTYAAIRLGLNIGIMSMIALLFQQFRILNWWIGGLIIVMVILIEAFFVTRD